MTKVQETISNIIEKEFGYRVQSWPASQTANNYPKVVFSEDPSNQVRRCVQVTQMNNAIYIKDFRASVKHDGFFTLQGQTIDLNSEQGKDLQQKAKELVVKQKESFKKRWKKISDSKDLELSRHPLFKDKNLKPISGIRKELNSVDTFETESLTKLDCVVVPFQNTHGDIVGAQLRSDKGHKYSVSDSSFSDSFHIVQEGSKDKFLMQKICLIAESYTTALEIAECRNRDMVVCGAGQFTMKWLYQYFSKDPDLFVIAVLDKNRYLNKKKPQYKATEELNQYFANKPHIIPAEHDPRAAKCTDFNDLSHALGKDEAHTRINHRVLCQLPASPKIFNNPDGSGFRVISSIDFRVYEVNPGDIKRTKNQLASPVFWRQFGYDDYDNGQLHQMFIEEAGINAFSDFVGVGIYKEEDSIIYNGYNAQRYLYKNGDMNKCTSPAPINLLYSTVPNSSNEKLDMNKELDPEFLEKLVKSFEDFYKLPPHYILTLLGWVVQASYASQSDIRPHLWITGSSASGKTFLLKLLTERLLPQFSILFEDFTANSIRTNLLPGGVVSSPIVFCDEVAPDTREKKDKLDMLLSMARSAATNSNAISSRATTDQKAINFVKKFAMCLTSTYSEFADIQDRSRFCLLNYTGNIVGKEEIEYETIKKTYGSYKEEFVKFLLENHDYYRLMVDEMTKEVNKIYKGFSLSLIGHSITSMSRVLAGVAVLGKHLSPELSNKEIVDKVIDNQQEFIKYNIDSLNEFQTTSLSVDRDLFLFKVRTGSFESRYLWQFLVAPDEKLEYYDRYGIKLEHYKGKLAFMIDAPFKKVNLLLESSKADHCIFGIQQKLQDLADAGSQIVNKVRPRSGNKRITRYLVYLNELDCGRIEQFCNERSIKL